MRTFLIVWLGQLISLLGSKLTEFALGFWILERTYRDTGTITQFAITILLIYLPKVIVSPIAGVLSGLLVIIIGGAASHYTFAGLKRPRSPLAFAEAIVTNDADAIAQALNEQALQMGQTPAAGAAGWHRDCRARQCRPAPNTPSGPAG